MSFRAEAYYANRGFRQQSPDFGDHGQPLLARTRSLSSLPSSAFRWKVLGDSDWKPGYEDEEDGEEYEADCEWDRDGLQDQIV